MYRESRRRSVLKALSYRFSGSAGTALLVLAFTGRVDLSLGIGVAEILVKMCTYFVHERVWDQVRFGRTLVRPAVIWLTGLSGAGKSTVAAEICRRFTARGQRVESLDGDVVRNIFPATGFTRPERDAHVKRVGYLASRLEQHGVFVVASLISPYREARDFVRSLCTRFVEIHVATPLEECERRDVKGLYAKARRGEVQSFTGISDPYEPPVHPELVLDTTGRTVEEVADQVMELLDREADG